MASPPPHVRAAQGGLLEREHELDQLDSLLTGLSAGEARVAVVEGAAGIGKSRLLTEARRRAAASGVRVLSARGGELERDFAFGVVRQLYEPALRDPAARDRLLAGAAAAADAVFDLVEAPPGEGDASFAVLHGLYWLTVNVAADGPVLLAVDDLHWCDGASLRFLVYLVRRLEGLPVLVLFGLRPTEPGVDTALVAELTGDPLATTVHPGALTEHAVGELVRERLGEDADARFVTACHTAAGGNPLLTNELLRALAAEGVRPDADHIATVEDLGPRAASRATLLRLARLPEDAIAVARAVAVLGDGARVADVSSLAELDRERVTRALAELVRAEIVRPEAALGFVHPLLGAAVYLDMPSGERSLQHARAARLLGDAGASAEQVAAHALAIAPAGEEWAVDALRRAAATALRRGGAESAVTYLARALAEPPVDEQRPQVLVELGLAEALTSGPAAARHLREAFEMVDDGAVRSTVGLVLARVLIFTGEPEEGAAVVRRLVEALPAAAVDERRVLEAHELSALLFAGNADAFARLERYRTLRERGLGAKMLAGLAAYGSAFAGDSADDCVELALHALSGGELVAADAGGVLQVAATFPLVFADRDEALDAWQAAFDDAHRHGSLFAIGGIHLWHGFTLYRRGELAEAREDLENAIGDFAVWGFAAHAGVYAGAVLAHVLVETGDLEAARRALELGDPNLTGDGARFWANARLDLLVAEGRAEEAVAVADEIAVRWPHVVNPAAGPWRSLKAQALDRLGRREEALAAAHEEVELARRFGAPWALGRALRVLGTIDRETGLEQLEEAVEVLERSSARLELAKALAVHGTALRLARRPSEAREPLRRALELAGVCGAASLADQARDELHATGARPRTTALRGVDSLTASERRVATLAAEGQTNRDIAQALYVTPKTVEVHLSSAYRKLQIRSRRQLASALAG